ncbi:MAG: efflux RND transporter periplasmic adaptor subunit [Acidobacteriota bacterium]
MRQAPVAVAVAAAHEEPLAILYRARGTVRGRSTIAVTSKVAGYVRTVAVRSGDQVKAGQLLVELEANDTRAGAGRDRAELAHAMDARVEAESSVDAARAAAELARTSRDRTAKLFAGGAVPRQEMDEADSRARVAEAQLAAAEARLRGAGSSIAMARAAVAESQATLDYARVMAPFAGRVVERRVDPGALASPGMPLLVLDDGASSRVEAAVEESRAASIQLGEPVSVEIAGMPASITGSVGEIVPNVDVASRAFTVKIDLPASAGHVQPGTFARVGFASGTRPRLVVPTTAISSLGALDRVYVVESGAAHLRVIARGEAQNGWTEVLAGLDPGEQVATDPLRLRDGTRVEVRR